MPDITMCEGGDCPLKGTCYRHTATPAPLRQSYWQDPPLNKGRTQGLDKEEEERTCDYYWNINER